MASNHTISIVGAGVAGLCIATELVSRGIIPTIYEKQTEVGPQSCSWWAGGMLAPFCEAESAEQDVVEYGQRAANWWQQHTQLVTQTGTLVVASNRDRAELVRFAQQTEHFEKLNQDEIARLEPDLSERFLQGLFFSSEAHLSPRLALAKLKHTLLSHNVRFVTKSIEPQSLQTEDIVVDCRGMSAKNDLPKLRGVKGEMLILRCPDVQFKRSIRLLHPRIPLYIVPRGEGIYMLGATMVESSEKNKPTARSIMELLSAAYAINPAFGEAEILEIGVDSRPAFHDNLPKISKQGNIIRSNGLYRHGFLLAPTLAKMVADYIELGTEPKWWHYPENGMTE